MKWYQENSLDKKTWCQIISQSRLISKRKPRISSIILIQQTTWSFSILFKSSNFHLIHDKCTNPYYPVKLDNRLSSKIVSENRQHCSTLKLDSHSDKSIGVNYLGVDSAFLFFKETGWNWTQKFRGTRGNCTFQNYIFMSTMKNSNGDFEECSFT